MAPLAAFVRQLRQETGFGADIPDFDPWDGGVEAECLFLLEAPGPRAVLSGFVSRNNPDVSAKNFYELNLEAGIPRERTASWNIVPWYLGTGVRIRAARQSDIESGLKFLAPLLALLPKLTTVVLVGRKAEAAEVLVHLARPELRMFRMPHPSPMFVNRAPGNRDRILVQLREVALFLRSVSMTT